MPYSLLTTRQDVRRRVGDSSGTPDFNNDLINNLINFRQRSIATVVQNYQPSFYTARVSYSGLDQAEDWTGFDATNPGGGAFRDDLGTPNRTEVYALPENLHSFVALYRRYGTSATSSRAKVMLVNLEDQELYRFSRDGRLRDENGEAYANETVALMTDNNMRILPAPTSGSFHYDLYYLRKPTNLIADNDQTDLPDDAYDWFILDVCGHVLTQTGDPLSNQFFLLSEKEKAQWIDNSKRNRSKSVNPIQSVTFW